MHRALRPGLRRYLPISLWILFFVGSSGMAQTYSWKDAEGRIHFSDTPPPNGRAEALAVPQAPERDERHVASGKRAIRYDGDAPSRRIRLEPPRFRLEGVPGETKAVGRTYTGAECRRAEPIAMAAGVDVPLDAGAANLLHGRFRELGYQMAEQRRFALQERARAPLALSGLITAAELKRCARRAGEPSTKNATTLVVEWELFDVERQRVVYSATTEGTHDSWYTPSRDGGAAFSLMAALADAGEVFLSDPEVVRLLTPETVRAQVAGTRSQSSGQPPGSAAEITWGDRAGSFRGQYDAIRAATVTIRNGPAHGSGLLVDDRHVLTNFHVVSGRTEVSVRLEKSDRTARVIAHNRHRDVALLELSLPANVRPLAIARTPAQLGASVFVVGTPLDLGLEHTLTRGIITGTRKIRGESLYQTDASVNPGNSGGPALDDHGEVIGMAVSGLFHEDEGLRVNYLIPIASALDALGI